MTHPFKLTPGLILLSLLLLGSSAIAQNVYQVKIKTTDGEKHKGYYSSHDESELRFLEKHSKKKNQGQQLIIRIEDISSIKIRPKRNAGVGGKVALGIIGGGALGAIVLSGVTQDDGSSVSPKAAAGVVGFVLGAIIGGVSVPRIKRGYTNLEVSSSAISRYLEQR